MKINEVITESEQLDELNFMSSLKKVGAGVKASLGKVGSAAASGAKSLGGWSHRKITGQEKPMKKYTADLGIDQMIQNWQSKVRDLEAAGMLDTDLSKTANIAAYMRYLTQFMEEGKTDEQKRSLEKPKLADIKTNDSLSKYFTRQAARSRVVGGSPATPAKDTWTPSAGDPKEGTLTLGKNGEKYSRQSTGSWKKLSDGTVYAGGSPTAKAAEKKLAALTRNTDFD